MRNLVIALLVFVGPGLGSAWGSEVSGATAARMQEQQAMAQLRQEQRQEVLSCQTQWKASWCKERLSQSQREGLRKQQGRLLEAQQAERNAIALERSKRVAAGQSLSQESESGRAKERNIAQLRRDDRLAKAQDKRTAVAQQRTPERLAQARTRYEKKMQRHQLRLAKLEAQRAKPGTTQQRQARAQ
jgi:hypothetical protein